ncbi:tripartite tricarboxylate transporter substrate-binding protein [Variovorax sp. J22R133]|uniref:tripartite tricarboxylate transporter substrate-binding protein n=1 Tax=Variovorax brevis TaxID=3053503 RepID=UPI002575994A|nr:tripartite tricarboxylate transporter substrate-binding protein [Variovorax sp. J22R133]MDM0117642.1 tripartite tricarboxylate transporter substrate-binding protein [Variovorax sp. J22R133]
MNTVSRRAFVGFTAQAAILATLFRPGAAAAAATPETLKLLFGFPPGGVLDALMRQVLEQLSAGYAKSTAMDYRTGVGGRLAAEALVASPANGSVMMHSPVGIFTFRPHIENVPFDPLNDVLPVTLTCSFANALAVGPMLPPSVKNVADFLDWCRANPQMANFGTTGVGTPAHMIGTLLSRASGVELRHIPYRSGAVIELLGGQVSALILAEGQFVPFANDGKLRILATSSTERSLSFPSAPTFAELGYKELVVRDWWGMFVPAKTPSELVQRLAQEVNAVLQRPEVREMLVRGGLRPASSTPAELAALMKSESARWAEVVRATGFSATS